MKRLTRQALVLIYGIIIISFLSFAFIVFKPNDLSQNKKEEKYTYTLVLENEKLMSTYIDSVSQEKSSSEFKEYRMTIEQGTKIGKYNISNQQIFSKYIQPLGPQNNTPIIEGSTHMMTHYAYSMLLVGDLVEKTNVTTKEKTYEIVNARITYNQIPISLLDEDDSVVIANSDKTKEKVINLQEFIDSLKNTQQRNNIIAW